MALSLERAVLAVWACPGLTAGPLGGRTAFGPASPDDPTNRPIVAQDTFW